MPEKTTLKAPAKINLFLEILGRRADGYHELRTLFYPLPTPHDTLEFEPRDREGLELWCSDPTLAGDDNLAARAWRAFAEKTGFAPGLRVRLTKGVPVAAGLGGGSSDAAAMLRFLNERAGHRSLGPEDLARLAAGLGADAPFFLDPRPSWAEGIGDRLRPVDLDLSGLSLVLVCPQTRVSTAWAYAEWDRLAARRPALTTSAPENKNSPPFSPLVLKNDFEAAVFDAHPELLEIKEKLLSLGASAAAMSGSGASVFGLFRKGAAAAAEAMGAEGAKVFVHGF
ncbi:MAG: 4-(cytidine 5'-diphospho)-2-C-methyl-D-erythritol kinase [Desulfovibrionaceae bacterium]|nr:4-(cytidine 5'-diphospho)-2-C-methyl-D-erythritol kinase [Desulfovibrionaceae bacterium]MDD4952706.1 4-(cytidine 5'-diphospho)-2-C-methyl-D-erythritol kinase [Desulfovibrionaceae bacterium]